MKDAQRFGPSPCHSCHPSCFENETVLTTLMVTAEYECMYIFAHDRLAGLLSRKNYSLIFLISLDAELSLASNDIIN